MEVEVAFLGIDIGGTNVRISIFHDLDDIQPLATERFAVKHDYERDLEQLQKTCRQIRPTDQLVEGIGIALAGVIDKERAVLADSGEKTAQWINQPFVKVLNGIFECPVILGNDAEAAALAEELYANPSGHDFWSIIWGTGIGGTLTRHPFGRYEVLPGEMGHMPVAGWDSSRVCDCGSRGCLEAYCGGKMIAKYEGVPAEQLGPERWQDLIVIMAEGVASAVLAQPVSRVYFSGAIAANHPEFIRRIEYLMLTNTRIKQAPQMQISHFGESAGTVGGLALLKDAQVGSERS